MSRPTPWRMLLLTAAIAVATATAPARAVAGAAGCGDAAVLPAETTSDNAATATLCLVNRERRRHKLNPLRPNVALSAASRLHADEMVRNRYFGQVSPTGATLFSRLLAVGYEGRGAAVVVAGENIAWGSGELATPKQIVAAWMRSQSHRANLLRRRFRDAGIGVADGTPFPTAPVGATYSMTFGTRRAR